MNRYDPHQWLGDYPAEILRELFTEIGITSCCHLYIKMPPGNFRYALGIYLQTHVINVTPEEVIEDDPNVIDFYTYGQLHLWCYIKVKTSVGLFDMTKWHLSKVNCRLVWIELCLRESPHSYVDVSNLARNVRALTVAGKITIDPTKIPRSIRHLFLLQCSLRNSQNFKHLVKLKEFESTCDHDETFELPRLVTTLKLYGEPHLLNMPSLPNIKHIVFNDFANIISTAWARVESLDLPFLPYHERFDCLREAKLKDYDSFRDIICPELESIEFLAHKISEDLLESDSEEDELDADFEQHYDILSIFTHEQLANLKILKASCCTIDNMALLPQLRVLHCSMDKSLTRFQPLPPNLIELKIILDCSVEGIPPQLQVFGFEGMNYDGKPDCFVRAKSDTVRKMRLCCVTDVSIDCPKLTSLNLEKCSIATMLKAPNLVRLRSSGIFISLEAFPRLNYLTMYDLNSWQDVVLNRHLKSIRLMWSQLGKVQLFADDVQLIICEFCRGAGAPQIMAKSFYSESTFDDMRGITCQEFNYDGWLCFEQIKRISPVVEKFSIALFGNASTNNHDKWYDTLSLEGFELLKSVTIKKIKFSGQFGNGIELPAAVRQVRLGRDIVWGRDAAIHYDEDSQLEHVEVAGTATMAQVGISRTLPPSLYFPQRILNFQPHLLRQHKTE